MKVCVPSQEAKLYPRSRVLGAHAPGTKGNGTARLHWRPATMAARAWHQA